MHEKYTKRKLQYVPPVGNFEISIRMNYFSFSFTFGTSRHVTSTLVLHVYTDHHKNERNNILVAAANMYETDEGEAEVGAEVGASVPGHGTSSVIGASVGAADSGASIPGTNS
jgi:hypothetical protein